MRDGPYGGAISRQVESQSQVPKLSKRGKFSRVGSSPTPATALLRAINAGYPNWQRDASDYQSILLSSVKPSQPNQGVVIT